MRMRLILQVLWQAAQAPQHTSAPVLVPPAPRALGAMLNLEFQPLGQSSYLFGFQSAEGQPCIGASSHQLRGAR